MIIIAQIGLNKLYFAPVTADSASGTTYGTPQRITGVVNINIQPAANTNTLYADDGAFAVSSALGEITVSLETAGLTLEQQAALLGHELAGGVLKYSNEDEAPYVALLFESKKHDGSTRYVKLLKGKFSEPQEDINTKGENVEFQTPTIEGSFVCRESDGAWRYTADSDNTSAAAAIAAWYTAVELPA